MLFRWCANRSLDRWLDTFSLDRWFYLCAYCRSGVTGTCRIGRWSAGFSGSLDLRFDGEGRFRRKILRGWRLLRESLPKLLRLILRNILPTPVYLRFSELSGNLGAEVATGFKLCGGAMTLSWLPWTAVLNAASR